MRKYRWAPVNRAGAAMVFASFLLLSVLPVSAQATPIVMKFSTATVHDTQTEWLPPDLQRIVRDDAAKTSQDVVPFVYQFHDEQKEIWKKQGGSLTSLPPGDQAAMTAKISSIAGELSASRPALNAAVKVVFAAASRNK